MKNWVGFSEGCDQNDDRMSKNDSLGDWTVVLVSYENYWTLSIYGRTEYMKELKIKKLASCVVWIEEEKHKPSTV